MSLCCERVRLVFVPRSSRRSCCLDRVAGAVPRLDLSRSARSWVARVRDCPGTVRDVLCDGRVRVSVRVLRSRLVCGVRCASGRVCERVRLVFVPRSSRRSCCLDCAAGTGLRLDLSRSARSWVARVRDCRAVRCDGCVRASDRERAGAEDRLRVSSRLSEACVRAREVSARLLGASTLAGALRSLRDDRALLVSSLPRSTRDDSDRPVRSRCRDCAIASGTTTRTPMSNRIHGIQRPGVITVCLPMRTPSGWLVLLARVLLRSLRPERP